MRLFTLALLALMGCKDGGIFNNDGDDTGPGTGTDDTGSTGPACLGDGFESSAQSWTLPSGAASWDDWMDATAESNSSDCTRSSFSATTFDLTGDGKLDLVVTDQCDLVGVGTDNWLVYENTGSRFAENATTWSLPSGVAGWDDWMDATAEANSNDCTRSSFTAATFDLTGDGKPDLVVTDNCDLVGVGTDNWLVYENTGSGFANSATTWALPSGVADWDDWMDATYEANSNDCTRSSFTATLLDLTGDRKPDLVVTDQCDLVGVGTDHWLVYENTGSGFASGANQWALPQGVASWDDWMDATAEANSNDCTRSSFTAVTMDLTGDRKPDLVVTDNCDLVGVGTDNWLVYENTGSGFASNATSWALPSGVADWDDWMDATYEANSTDCVRSSFTATTADLTGDGKPDLVVTDNCDLVGVGTDEWLVYENTGSGFSGSPLSWPLPQGVADWEDWLDSMAEANSSDCTRSSFTAVTMDLTGDGVVDLVVTDQCDLVGVGTDDWRVWPGTCSVR
ncbi:MAG: VCBS repeat-containing protein [Alphaproteobacteria bacterium]|nr:VCBS repeat-containing protein [Alphaproteobacteria bacterium]